MARLTEKRDLDVLLRIDAQVTFKLKLKESLHKLVAPEITYIMNDLKKRGFDVKTDALTIDEGIAEITERLQEKGIF